MRAEEEGGGGLRRVVGSIAGIQGEQTNQDSELKNKVLRPPPAVSELLSSWLRVTKRIPLFSDAGSRFVRVMKYANRLAACGGNAILFSLFLMGRTKYCPKG